MEVGCAYIRVSTDEQTELSPDAQKREILKYAKAHDILIPPEYIFVENGISGKRADRRPEFQRMIAIAKTKPKPFDVVLLWKFSRFARNQDESTFYKSILRKKCGIDVRSITEPVMEGMYGRLIETIIEWSDEFYSYNLAQEVRRGMTENALRGGYQAAAPIGYQNGKKGEPPEIIPERAAIVRQIFEEYAAGFDRTGIARRLNNAGHRTDRGNKFENRTIEYILSNPFYIGKVRWNYTVHGSRTPNNVDDIIEADGKHEPIISQELFEKVQERLSADRRPMKSRAASTGKHWLSGMMVCSSCGHTLAFSGSGKSRNFQCYHYAKGKCNTSHSITIRKAEVAVLEELRNTLRSGSVEYVLATAPEEAPDIAPALKRLDAREQRAKEAYLAGIDTLEEYKHFRELIQKERKELQSTIPPAIPQKDSDTQMITRISHVCDILQSDTFTMEQKGNALRSILQKIVYDKPNETMHFYYHYS